MLVTQGGRITDTQAANITWRESESLRDKIIRRYSENHLPEMYISWIIQSLKV